MLSPYYNYLQWYVRGRRYSRREISPCYRLLYDQLADIALDGRSSAILEYGCGDAYLLRTIRARNSGVRLFGCDFSKTQIKSAKSLLQDATFDCQNVTSMTYADKAFDVAIGLSVLMYLNPHQLDAALRELRRTSRRIVLAEMSCRHFDEERARLFRAAQDGRFDYDYEKECRKAGFVDIRAGRCEHFWNPEINTLGEMGYSIIIANSD